MKISKAIELFWLDKKLEFSKNTIETYSYTFRYLVDFMTDKDIEAITKRDILLFLDYLSDARKLSKRSLFDTVARLSSLWTWATVELKIDHVTKDIDIKFTKTIVEPFSQDEVKALIDSVETSKRGGKRPYIMLDRAIMLVLLDSGLRASELCSLTIADYDDKTGRLLVKNGKGGKPRLVILGNRARKALYKYLATRKNPKQIEPLFATRTGTHFHRDNLRHKLEGIAKVANVSNVHPHRFRHTFAINFLRNGGNIFVLQQLLGHSTLDMVRHYAKIAEVDIEKASEFSVADSWRL